MTTHDDNEFSSGFANFSTLTQLMRPISRPLLYTTPSETFLFPRDQDATTSNVQDEGENTLTLEKITAAMREMEVVPQLPRIIESEEMVDRSTIIEDWSLCRSPSRAKRREKRGHRQRVVRYSPPRKDAVRIGNDLYMHPVTALEMRRELSARVELSTDKALALAYMGMRF